MSQNQRPTWAEISIPALVYNFQRLRRHLSSGVQLMAVVKADAYGHGAIECARALEGAGADWFGVALVEEGRLLREGGIRKPIFCLGGFSRGQAPDVVAHDLTPAVFRLDLAEELDAAGREADRVVRVHIKVDTGIGRFGIPAEDTGDFARRLLQLTHLKIDGLLTHFATADEIDKAYLDQQIRRYDEARRQLNAVGIDPRWRHLANSAAIHAHPSAWGNLARAGASLYGLERDVFAAEPEPLGLRPVLSLHSRIAFLKDVPGGTSLGYGRTFVTRRRSVIATLPIGYADGLRRAHSNSGKVIVNGSFAPVVGRISMDLTMIDVTHAGEVALGDEVILIGSQGELEIRAEDLAEDTGTISYEVVCAISSRVPRVFLPSTPQKHSGWGT
ncbi:MAG: alanine racemase [Acidobacteriota bacterium]